MLFWHAAPVNTCKHHHRQLSPARGRQHCLVQEKRGAGGEQALACFMLCAVVRRPRLAGGKHLLSVVCTLSLASSGQALPSATHAHALACFINHNQGILWAAQTGPAHRCCLVKVTPQCRPVIRNQSRYIGIPTTHKHRCRAPIGSTTTLPASCCCPEANLNITMEDS